MEAELTIEGYAEMQAYLRHFGAERTTDVLEYLGISEFQRSAASKKWLSALAEEARQGGRALSDRYVATFGSTTSALETNPPDLRPALEQPESVQEATALGPPAQPAAPLPASASTDGTPSPAPEPPRYERPSCLLIADAPAEGRDRSPWAVADGFGAGSPTETTCPAVPTLGPVLPFHPSDSPAPAAMPTPRPILVDQSGETQAVPVLRPDADPTLPFVSALPPEEPRLTLNQYASLFAELSVTPGAAEAVFVRYGLPDEAARRALERAWRAKFRADPALRDRFHALVTEYQAWVAAHPKYRP